jgi:hypothetical protein
MAGRIEVEDAPRDRGAVHQEEHRPRRLTGFRRAKPLAKNIKRNIAFFRPVFGTPDFAVGCGLRWRCRTG